MRLYCEVHINDAEIGWKCLNCQADIARNSDLIPGEFTGKLGPALFMKSAYNVCPSKSEVVIMRTGEYEVQRINCISCQAYLGWLYKTSFASEFRYKEGKYCLESEALKDCRE